MPKLVGVFRIYQRDISPAPKNWKYFRCTTKVQKIYRKLLLLLVFRAKYTIFSISNMLFCLILLLEIFQCPCSNQINLINVSSVDHMRFLPILSNKFPNSLTRWALILQNFIVFPELIEQISLCECFSFTIYIVHSNWGRLFGQRVLIMSNLM